jgi:hypothetical protein
MVNARADFLVRGILFVHQIGAPEIDFDRGGVNRPGRRGGLAGNTTARRGLRR